MYELLVHFNSDNIDRAQYISATPPDDWSLLYIGPSAGNYTWKVRFRADTASVYVMQGDSLCNLDVRFTWSDSLMLPGAQKYDLKSPQGSEPGTTEPLLWDPTPVEATSWGKIKSLFFK